MKYNLETRYDHCKSFYGKAVVYILEQNADRYIEELKSYETRVARVEYYYSNGETEKIRYLFYGNYSRTTKRHQVEFFKQHGLNIEEINKLVKEGVLEK